MGLSGSDYEKAFQEAFKKVKPKEIVHFQCGWGSWPNWWTQSTPDFQAGFNARDASERRKSMNIVTPKYRFNTQFLPKKVLETPRKFQMVTQEDGVKWFVPTDGEPSEIYKSGFDKRGFGGRALTFTLLDDTEFSVIGPWNISADELYRHTNIDLRDKHRTMGIVALRSEAFKFGGMGNDYYDVLHLDFGPVVGTIDRIPNLAQDFANKHNITVVYQVVTAGGGQMGSKRPRHD